MVVRIQPLMLAALDDFISGQADTPSRPEAVRRLLTDTLIGLGLLETGHGKVKQ